MIKFIFTDYVNCPTCRAANAAWRYNLLAQITLTAVSVEPSTQSDDNIDYVSGNTGRAVNTIQFDDEIYGHILRYRPYWWYSRYDETVR